MKHVTFRRSIGLFSCLAGALAMMGAAPHSNQAREKKDLQAKLARLAPVELTADVSRLSSGDRQALSRLIEASKYMDPIFLRQVWNGNVDLEKKLEADKSPLGRLRLEWFVRNAGPWSRLDRDEPFIDGVPKEKPSRAGFYPEDLTKAEFESWLKTLSEDQRQAAIGFFTVIDRKDGKLVAIPYSEVYKAWLDPSAKLLKEAADLTTNASLAKFLRSRADAFSSNNYYASDVDWMDIDAPVDPTIGPYEVYEDGIFNYKAAFEAFINVRDDAETSKLGRYSGYLQDIENNLPEDDKYKSPKLGASAPIRVVNEVFAAGDARRGIATAAYNLPNDEKVNKEKGSKRVLLKNVQEAKFEKVLMPIAHVVLPPSAVSQVAFDPFFTHILMHELMHGLGPHNLTVDGKETPVRMQLKDVYSAIEEAKADITGLYAMQYLIDKGELPKSLEKSMYTTYLASMFR